jgi:uncharacterized protein (TIGR03435 family)
MVRLLCAMLLAAFEVASVKPSRSLVGHDGDVTMEPDRITVRNATLKRLIFEAYHVPYSQITGGPPWLDSNEYDIDAKAAGPVGADQLRLMLRTLLIDRFKLAVRSESKERRVYVLTVGKDGPRLSGSPNGKDAHRWSFHGDLSQFAGILAVQLTIPFLDDPTTPSHARGAPVPVLDKTGVAGVYDISLDIKPEPGSDPFAVWQRALQEQLGLKLESQKALVEILIVDHVEKVPTEN